MLTEKEYQHILDFDWTGVDVRDLIFSIQKQNAGAAALFDLQNAPKQDILTSIFKKMIPADIDTLEQKLYGNKIDNDIFIIHADSDKMIANAIENELNVIFGKEITSFNASNPDGIKGGEDWFNYIVSQHRRSKFGLVLITENSFNNIWINFETGGFFLRNKNAVIPLIYTESVLSKLVYPLKGIQGKKLWIESFRKSLIEEISTHIDRRILDFNDERFCKNIFETIKEVSPYGQAQINADDIKVFFLESFNRKSMQSTIELHGNLLNQFSFDSFSIRDTFKFLEEMSDEGDIKVVQIDGATIETTFWRKIR